MKILIFASTSWNHFNSRLALAGALKARGHKVVFASPKDEFTPQLLADGFRWHDIPLAPRGTNLLREARSILALVHVLRRSKPDVLCNFTPKGVIYGSIASRFSGVHRVVNTITGLGGSIVSRSTSPMQWRTRLYRLALPGTITLFQNPDDERVLREAGVLRADSQVGLVPGSGVDMTRFAPSPEPDAQPPVVMLHTRFVEEKGIRYFVEASRLVQQRGTRVRMVLVGQIEPDQPTAIRHDELTNWVSEGLVEWWGWHNHMEEIVALSHIVCLPTFYGEGVPKSLIEAAACQRPIIASDVPGCRSIVRHGENGLLVPPMDAEALAQAICDLATNHDLRRRMGLRAREIAVAGFSIQHVTTRYLEAIEGPAWLKSAPSL